MNPTTRPTSRAGYMAPHRRRWNGPPNERLIQKTKATAIITGATGTTNTSRSEAAPMPRISASCAEERGPNRPAKALRRLATKGAAASADRPRGSRPPRRAIVGRRAVTSAIETPTPIAATRSSARLRPSARRLGDGLNDGDRNTTYLEAALLACEVSCRARRGSAVASCDSPRSVGPPSSDEEVRPLPTIAASGVRCGWPGRPGRRSLRGTMRNRTGVRSCGDAWFRQGPVTGEREPRMLLRPR